MKESAVDSGNQNTAGGGGSVDVSASASGFAMRFGDGQRFSFGNNRFEAQRLGMSAFVGALARFVDRPVIDATRLEKTYDFSIELTEEDFRAMFIRSALVAGVTLPPQALRALEGSSGDSLFRAVETLGLRLESRKGPVEMFVIDHIEKKPTEN